MDENTLANVHLLFARTIPFNQYLGMEVDHLESGLARLRLPFRPELIGDPMRPALHGGVISALLDTTGGLAVWSRLTLQDRISTVDLRVDYLLPGRAELLLAEGRVRRLGNHLGVAALRAWHPDRPEDNVAEGMAVYNLRRHHGD